MKLRDLLTYSKMLEKYVAHQELNYNNIYYSEFVRETAQLKYSIASY